MTTYRIIKSGRLIAMAKAEGINAARQIVADNFADTSDLLIEEIRRDSFGVWVWAWSPALPDDNR